MIIKTEIEISDEAIDILKKLKEKGYAEFRDNFASETDFLESVEFKLYNKTLEWYRARNFCDIKIIEELDAADLVKNDFDSWHLTYTISEKGEDILKIIEQNEQNK